MDSGEGNNREKRVGGHTSVHQLIGICPFITQLHIHYSLFRLHNHSSGLNIHYLGLKHSLLWLLTRHYSLLLHYSGFIFLPLPPPCLWPSSSFCHIPSAALFLPPPYPPLLPPPPSLILTPVHSWKVLFPPNRTKQNNLKGKPARARCEEECY